MQLSLLAKLHQIYDPLLCLCVSLDVALRGAECAMASQHLDVTRRAAKCSMKDAFMMLS